MQSAIAWMLRIVREARFAAVVAWAVVAGFSASSAWAGPQIQLSDIAAGMGGFAIGKESMNDESGWNVSGAGDVNGDGLADLIVGAPRSGPNGLLSGRSYVVFGKASGTFVQLSDVRGGIGGFAIEGEASGDFSGESVSAAGDVNGDGLADLIVGALRADANGLYNSGRSYVVFGKATTMLVQLSDVTSGTGGFAIDGEGANDVSGASVSTAGDVNGDGLADLIVGAPLANANGLIDSGRSYVVFGKADGTRVELRDITRGIGGFAIDGELGRIDFEYSASPGGYSGGNVSAGGDINGDGLGDLIVGAVNASYESRSGRSYVIFGKAIGTRVRLSDITAGIGGFAIDGEARFDESSRSLSVAGDVDGDGLADLIIGAQRADSNGTDSGSGYLVFGKATGTRVQLSDVTAGAGGFAIYGESAYDRMGWSVSTAGDFNGDGLADLIFGAIRADVGEPNSGRNYVVFGKAGGTRVEPADIAAGIGGFTIEAEAGYKATGAGVSGAGDVNGDGLADLIVGSAGSAGQGGRCYVIFSPQTPPRSAVYNAFSRAGDGPGGEPVLPTVVGESRLTIDWPDDDFGRGNFGFGSSKERVVLNRSNAPIRNLQPIANVAQVCWSILHDRFGAGRAELTFKYLNHEIADIALGSEADLAIFTAEDFEGPWIKLPTMIDAARNTARVTVALATFKHFALAEAGTASVPPRNAAEHFKMYE